MDPTSSESSIKYSIKEYFLTFVENGLTGVGVPVLFDAFSGPMPDSIKKWVLVSIDSIGIKKSSLSDIILTLFLHTREDAEGFELSVLRDTLFSLLSGSHNSVSTYENMIPLYDIITKEQRGSIVVMTDQSSSGNDFSAADGTRYKIITIPLKMASK